MASALTGLGTMRALLVPDEREVACTFTADSQAGARAGVPTPGQRTAMVLEALGQLDRDLGTIEVATLRAGAPDVATVRWRYAGDTDWRHWDPPWMCSEFQWLARSTTAAKWSRPHALRSPASGLARVVAVEDLTGVTVWTQAPAGSWTSTSVEETGDDTAACLLALPSGRLLCLYVVAVGATTSQVRMAYSDDDGTTWTIGTDVCLDDAIGVASDEIQRLRAVYLAGQVMLLVWHQDTADTIRQYVSLDEGASFEAVEVMSTTDEACPDLAVQDGEVLVATVTYDAALPASTLVPVLRRVSSCSTPLSSVSAELAVSAADATEWAARTGSALTSVELALVADDDRRVYLYGRDHHASGTAETTVAYSYDGGRSWITAWQSPSHPSSVAVHGCGDAATYLRDITAVAERGRVLLVSRHVASPGTGDDSLGVLYLGGYTTVGMPEDATYAHGSGVAGWEHLYLPLDEPDATGGVWTVSVGGTPTRALTRSGLGLTCPTPADSVLYYANPSISGAPGYGLLLAVQVTVGGGTWFHDLRISDGTDGYRVRVQVTTTAIELRDLVTATSIATIATTDAADGVVLLIALDHPSGAWTAATGRVRAWYRPATDGVQVALADRHWFEIGTSTTLGSMATASSLVQFGTAADGTAAYRWLGYAGAQYTAGNIGSGGPTRGRVVPPATRPTHLVEGLRIYAARGPTLRGDTWDVPTDYEHPASAARPWTSPSPRRRHRSVGVASALTYTWRGFRAERRGVWGLVVIGANWRTATLDIGATTMSVDLRVQTTLPYTVEGRALVPRANVGANSLAGGYVHADALKGGTIDLGGGDIRKIRANRAGWWRKTDPGVYTPLAVLLDDDTGLGVFGTCDLWTPAAVYLFAPTVDIEEPILTVDAQTTADGYLETGIVALMRLEAFCWEYEGRAVELGVAHERVELRNGARIGRQLAPPRRAVEFGWPGGVNGSTLYDGEPSDYRAWGGSIPISTLADTPWRLEEALLRARGGARPVVYLPQVKVPSSGGTEASPLVIKDPARFLYGRIVSERTRLDNVLGDEFEAEVLRVNQVRIEEEV